MGFQLRMRLRSCVHTRATRGSIMTTDTITIEGMLREDGVTLQLREKVDLPPGRVTVTVQAAQPMQTGNEPAMVEVLERILRERRSRGRMPITEEQMAAEISAIRADEDDYEKRCKQIWARTGPQSTES